MYDAWFIDANDDDDDDDDDYDDNDNDDDDDDDDDDNDDGGGDIDVSWLGLVHKNHLRGIPLPRIDWQVNFRRIWLGTNVWLSP